MKKALLILGLAAAPALFAAETNTASNAVELAPVSLVEQASLVREIAEDASRGFDAEAHAKWVRQQIEAVRDQSVPAIANSVRMTQSGSSTTNARRSILPTTQVQTAKRPASEELQQVIERLRILKQGLETDAKSE